MPEPTGPWTAAAGGGRARELPPGREPMTAPPALPPALVWQDVVRRALVEDLGQAGDITSDAVLAEGHMARAELIARVPGVVAGLAAFAAAFELVDRACVTRLSAADGDAVARGNVLAVVEGPARAVLAAERVALNVLQRLSGTATLTRAFVETIAGTGARVTCTRKTTPGLRALEKYAVRCGGGSSHRYGLSDAVLIKDNHVALAGGVIEAVRRVRASVGHMVVISLEVTTLDQLRAALALPIDVVLLDNMGVEMLREAVALIDGRVVSEASGGITLATARAIAETGVGYLSVGALTHSAPALDLALDVVGPAH